ncbi:hypothetical protein E2320_020469 [Naja naja]|nr:hypothetical protein E2320_020469 [Naja naja]
MSMYGKLKAAQKMFLVPVSPLPCASVVSQPAIWPFAICFLAVVVSWKHPEVKLLEGFQFFICTDRSSKADAKQQQQQQPEEVNKFWVVSTGTWQMKAAHKLTDIPGNILKKHWWSFSLKSSLQQNDHGQKSQEADKARSTTFGSAAIKANRTQESVLKYEKIHGKCSSIASSFGPMFIE